MSSILMVEFQKHVSDVMSRQVAGLPVSTVFGQKLDGKRFALVKTKVLWYAVRLVIENSYAVEREEFFEEAAADHYIARKKRELES